MEPINRARRKGREGVMIAAPGANDEVSLHRAPALAAAVWPQAIMSPRRVQSFHLARSEVDSTNAGGTELDADQIAFCGLPAHGVHEFYALRVVVTEFRASDRHLGRA
jgi:hypothetical protein